MENNHEVSEIYQLMPGYIPRTKGIQETVDFASLELNKPLTQLQQKLFYMTVASIGKDEDPEAQALYRIDVRNIAELSEIGVKSLRRNLKRAVEAMNNMAEDLNLRSPTIIDRDGRLKRMYGIYQGIEIDVNDPNAILARFNYYFRQQILKMKKEYDIEYPIKSIMKLNGDFTIPLYTFLIAEAAIIREKRTVVESNNIYDIYIERDDLLRKLNYTNRIGVFNTRALPAACKEINKNTEVYIENEFPDLVKTGRTITGYMFHVHITTSISAPIFTRSLIRSKSDLIPSMEYLADRLRLMGVGESTIKHYQAEREPDRLRIWGNMLYTWHMQGDRQPRYYKKAYAENYFQSVCGNIVEKIFRLVILYRPEIADDYMRAIDAEYTKRGVPVNPDFLEDLLKRIVKKKKAEQYGDYS